MNQPRDLHALALALQQFADARDWDKFHTPKNLSMALAKESAELMEPFQWMTPHESASLDEKLRAKVSEEVGDVLIYLVRLSSKLGIDPLTCAWNKLEINGTKYPADKVRGSAAKYTDY